MTGKRQAGIRSNEHAFAWTHRRSTGGARRAYERIVCRGVIEVHTPSILSSPIGMSHPSRIEPCASRGGGSIVPDRIWRGTSAQKNAGTLCLVSAAATATAADTRPGQAARSQPSRERPGVPPPIHSAGGRRCRSRHASGPRYAIMAIPCHGDVPTSGRWTRAPYDRGRSSSRIGGGDEAHMRPGRGWKVADRCGSDPTLAAASGTGA